MQWLTVNQTLEDIASFIRAKNEEMKAKDGKNHKWVVIGGSYPGALVVWLKERYPELVSVVWSSSGVVKLQMDYDGFDYGMF